jgi:transcriptional regulator with XRE-family HTH domain
MYDQLLDAAIKGQQARSDRDLSLKLGKAHNYVHNVRTGHTTPSPEALAELCAAAGIDPAKPVLQFIRDQHSGEVRKILDKALKLMTAASFAMLICTAGPRPADAADGIAPAVEKVYIMRQVH